MKAKLKPFAVDVEEITTEEQVKQFKRNFDIGDVILTHANGARLPMKRSVFEQVYEVIPE